jgi:N-acetylglucosaminyl-diphospho-decaprenol L-rhamnosyltransferase
LSGDVEGSRRDVDSLGAHEAAVEGSAIAGSFAVVIVSYRTPDLTSAAARSALAAGADRVIVVDNRSGDDTPHLLRAIGDPRVVVVENPVNSGFGTAANIGARDVSADALLFLNSDAELTTEAADHLLAELARWRGRAIIGPRLVAPDGAVEHSAGLLPVPSDIAVRALGLHVIGWWLAALPVVGPLVRRTRFLREYASAEVAKEVFDTSFVSGACFAMGREAFQELGGFDEQYFMYFEDADLCRRATARGMAIRYVPSAVVTHVRGASTMGDYPFGPLRSRSMRQYLRKWYGLPGWALAIVLLWLRALRHSVGFHPGSKRAWRSFWAARSDEDPRK